MNLLSLLARLTKNDPHAIIAIDADPDQPQHVSRAELWRRTLQLRADLATAGVGRGDGVLVVLPAWSSLLDWQIATASLGAVLVALPPTTPVADLAEALRRVRPVIVAVPPAVPSSDTLGGPGRVPVGEAVHRARCPAPGVAVVTGPADVPPLDPSPYDVGRGAWLPSAATAGMPMPEVRGDELAAAFHPTFTAHRESTLARHAAAVAAAWDLGGDDVVLCTRPPSEAVWLVCALAALTGGATCLLEPSPTPWRLADGLDRFGVTQLLTDDETVVELAAAERPHSGSARVLRWVGVLDRSGALADAVRRADELFGVTATAVYTPAEVLPLLAWWPGNGALRDRVVPGGASMSPEVELATVDPVTGLPTPSGTRGEVRVRGYPVPDAVLGAHRERPSRVTDDGWWRTTDLGSLDEAGRLRTPVNSPGTATAPRGE